MRTHYAVAVVGAGHAGLSISFHLKERGIDHVVLERERIGHAWRSQRWDSFCLVTPNWQCKLPGFPYRGPDPHGFMRRDEIVRYVEEYAASFDPPVAEATAVTKLARRRGEHAFELETTAGTLTAEQVVVAAGGYHVPSIPRIAERLNGDILQLHSADYRNPAALPNGDVLVVGSGQSGAQIAEDLHLAGRSVHLCVGSAPRTARRFRGKDVVEWLDALGYYDMPVHDHPLKERVRQKANHYVTGRDGGRDIDLRRLAREGMRLYGRLRDVRDGALLFAPDLKENLDRADAVAESIKTTIERYIAQHGLDAPTEARYQPVWEPETQPMELDYRQAGIRSIVWCVGFRNDYRWIELPVFDGSGYPVHERGVTPVAGLYFLGLPWLYTWGSGRFSGVGRDAAFLADAIEAAAAGSRPSGARSVNELALGS